MSEPDERSFPGLSPTGFHSNVYWDWPAAGNGEPTLIAMHGLTRNGRDFDAVARVLSGRRRVVCPDVVGRGKSGWLGNAALYGYPQYLADAAALIGHVGDGQAVDWLGTSMGGLVGMMLAAQPLSPIRRLILNDVGPFIPKASLERIGAYVGQDPRFPDVTGVEAYLRRVHASFGDLSDVQWAHMAAHSARALEGGGYGLAYDPKIAEPFRTGPIADVDLWPVWDAIGCPVLILRGATSDLLLAKTADEMVRRKPDAKLVTFQGCGHAPALMDDDQVAVIRDWLEATP